MLNILCDAGSYASTLIHWTAADYTTYLPLTYCTLLCLAQVFACWNVIHVHPLVCVTYVMLLLQPALLPCLPACLLAFSAMSYISLLHYMYVPLAVHYGIIPHEPPSQSKSRFQISRAFNLASPPCPNPEENRKCKLSSCPNSISQSYSSHANVLRHRHLHHIL